VIRQTHLIAVVGAFLIAVVMVGCGSGPGYIDELGGEEGAAATNAETTAPEGDRSVAGTAQGEPVGFDEEVVSPPGQANVPEGFGEGSLWATESHPNAGCDDVKGDSASAGSASATSEALCTASAPPKTVLKRVDPRSGEVVAEIPLEGLNDVFTQMAFGAGSVWASSGYYGTLSRIDPQTGEVVANIDVDRGAGDIAADESSGAVWVAGVSTSDDERENEKLSRVDPETNRVAAGIPIPADAMSDGADG
jgi:hypothetical protein